MYRENDEVNPIVLMGESVADPVIYCIFVPDPVDPFWHIVETDMATGSFTWFNICLEA